MNATLLELSNVHKHYQNGATMVRALDGVSLTVQRGEFIAIMGQSGSGKSTLMNIIGCLDRPTSGSYRVLGKEAAHLSPDELARLRRETFGFVFQRYNLLATATAGENVEIPSVYAGLPKHKPTPKDCCNGSGSVTAPIIVRRNSPAASNSGWRSRGRW